MYWKAQSTYHDARCLAGFELNSQPLTWLSSLPPFRQTNYCAWKMSIVHLALSHLLKSLAADTQTPMTRVCVCAAQPLLP